MTVIDDLIEQTDAIIGAPRLYLARYLALGGDYAHASALAGAAPDLLDQYRADATAHKLAHTWHQYTDALAYALDCVHHSDLTPKQQDAIELYDIPLNRPSFETAGRELDMSGGHFVRYHAKAYSRLTLYLLRQGIIHERPAEIDDDPSLDDLDMSKIKSHWSSDTYLYGGDPYETL